MHAIVHVDAGCASAKLLTPLNMGGYGSMWTNSTKRWPFRTTPVMRKSGQVSATCNSLKQVAGQHIYNHEVCNPTSSKKGAPQKKNMVAHNHKQFHARAVCEKPKFVPCV